MNISLPAAQKRFVERAVKSGRYQSASEVIREGIRQIEQNEAKRRELQRLLDEGVRDIEAGRVHSREEVMGEWRRRDAAAAKRAPRRRKSA